MQTHYIVHDIPDSILILGIIAIFVVILMSGMHYLTHRTKPQNGLWTVRSGEWARPSVEPTRSVADAQQSRKMGERVYFTHPNNVTERQAEVDRNIAKVLAS